MRYSDDGIMQLPDSCNEADHIEVRLVNQWLREEQEKWPVIYGQLEIKDHIWNTKNPEWHDTHVSRLMPPRPIQKDTAENILEDLVKQLDVKDRDNRIELSTVVERARKLLESEKV